MLNTPTRNNESFKLELYCRMLGNPHIVNTLKKVVRIEKPKIVFLMDKKSDRDWMVWVCGQCGFKQVLIVPSKGSSSRLLQ